VLAAIGALMAGILIGRRVRTVVPVSADGASVADLVRGIVRSLRNRVELLDDASKVVSADPPGTELTLARTPRGDAHASEDSDAVRLEATRRDFVANVSHELKTPVGAMALLAEAVLDAADDPHEVRRFGTKILNEANRLGTLVTELIALSRLQGAERLPELATVEVDHVIHAALERCRLAAESANIRITTDPPSGLLLHGDATLLITALSNLLDNAVSYSPPGSPVSISRRLTEGYVEIAVTDRGLGIAPEHQQRVFERFFRIDQARSRSTGGTGLGLAIVKHVAANHGGEVNLWSKPGTGSTFTLRIPAHPDNPKHLPPIPERVAANTMTATLIKD
jgi:two-component system, OmpR family, sensor histidine kinase SenX3